MKRITVCCHYRRPRRSKTEGKHPVTTTTDTATDSTAESTDTVSEKDSNLVFWKKRWEEAAPIRSLIRLMEAHPWLAAGMLSLLIATKLLGVAAGDVGTAGLILGAGGFSGLASIIALAVTPQAIAAACVILCLMTGAIAGAQRPPKRREWRQWLTSRGVRQARRTKRKQEKQAKKGKKEKVEAVWALPLVLTIILCLPLLIVVPWMIFSWLLVVAVVGAFSVCAYYRKRWRDYENAKADSSGGDSEPELPTFSFGSGGLKDFAVFAVLLLFIGPLAAATNNEMWLPDEKITISSPATGTTTTRTTTTTTTTDKPPVTTGAGTTTETVTNETVASVADGADESGTVTGYVLSRDGDYTTILMESPRTTRTVPSDTITARERCDLPGKGTPTLPIFGTWPEYGVPC